MTRIHENTHFYSHLRTQKVESTTRKSVVRFVSVSDCGNADLYELGSIHTYREKSQYGPKAIHQCAPNAVYTRSAGGCFWFSFLFRSIKLKYRKWSACSFKKDNCLVRSSVKNFYLKILLVASKSMKVYNMTVFLSRIWWFYTTPSKIGESRVQW